MASSIGNRRGGDGVGGGVVTGSGVGDYGGGGTKPQVEIYRPGSGPLKKSVHAEDDFYGDSNINKHEKTPQGITRERYKRDERNPHYKFSDDFDRLSISSNSSRKGGSTGSFRGSTGSLSEFRRKGKKPEAAIYVPPKPLPGNEENRTYNTKNFSNSQRGDSFRGMREDLFVSKREDSSRRCVNSLKNDESKNKDLSKDRRPSYKGRENDRCAKKREVESSSKNGRLESERSNQWSDRSSIRGESEPPEKRPGERRKSKRNKNKNRRGNKDESTKQSNRLKVDAITPLMDLKFDGNPLGMMAKSSSSIDVGVVGYETSGYTTTDGESERDPLCSLRDTKGQIPRGMRQASEPRSLPAGQADIHGRDTRSVEPGEDNIWGQDRYNNKPPSGQYSRRAGKLVHPKHKQTSFSFESLPPRLQKKYMEENGLQEPPIQKSYPPYPEHLYLDSNPKLSFTETDSEPSSVPVTFVGDDNSKPIFKGLETTYIGTNSEDPWDGSSVVFQGANPPRPTYYTNVPPPSMFSHPPPPISAVGSMSLPPPSAWSQTLPLTKSKGRGRVPQHELERDILVFEDARMTRSLTPNVSYEEEYFDQPLSLLDKSSRSPVNQSTMGPEQIEKNKTTKQMNNTTSFSSNTDLRSPTEKQKPRVNELQINETKRSDKQPSPIPPKSPQDVTFSKVSGTGMNWADEVELSERLQETLEERGESEDNTYSLSNSNMSPTGQPASMPHRERRRRRRRSGSRDRHHTSDRRRSSVDAEDIPIKTISRSRKNSGDDRQPISRSRKNSEDDRNWSRSRKNSGDDKNWSRSRKNSADDKNWRRDENRDPFDSFKKPVEPRFGSRNSSRNNSRNNSAERRPTNDYQHFNGSERRFRGNGPGPEQFRRAGSKHFPAPSDRHFPNTGQRRGSRDFCEDGQKDPPKENWRDEARRFNGPGPLVEKKQQKSGGIIVLPQSTLQREPESKGGRSIGQQKQLFNPSNPHRPLIINAANDGSRGPPYSLHDGQYAVPAPPPVHTLHNPNLLKEAEIIDYELNHILMTSSWYEYHDDITKRRARLQEIMWQLLTSDIKFCQQENMEQYFWKILYYNLIECLRKQMGAMQHNKESLQITLLNIIDEGVKFFENTLHVLEECYKFRLDDHLAEGLGPARGKPHLTMALLSVQKLLLFLGDLARYREQVHDSSNFGQARQWYIKAHQLNPKNGRPYNQLAILAVYARRKLDAVYYYMRSLIATISVASSKESLLTLFDENRKKYEMCERQRREDREQREHEKMKEKECDSRRGTRLRREIWIHPEGGRRVHRTTSAAHDQDDSEVELEALPHIDLNKRFMVSFIHVHGKLFTKIGMESFQGAALQMLKEFRALLQLSPLPLPPTRLLLLLALNMFAIENTQLKNNDLGPGYRSALQESALVTSLQMFSLILERAMTLLQDQLTTTYRLIVSDDVNILLPAIKVWCDWLLCHSAVWNPPPSCNDYRVGPAGDCWGRLAALVNLLEKLNHQQHILSDKKLEGYNQVRLAEDSYLAGFLPLMFNCAEPVYISKEDNMEVAQVSLRIQRIMFCGTVFLCGVDPPVLKLQKKETGDSEYISVVETPSPPTQSDGELCMESVSSGESDDSGQASEDEGSESCPAAGSAADIQTLLQRKHELERSHRRQEKRQQRVQNILQSSLVTLVMEVRPHYLVADTNCFIDYLPQLQTIAKASSPSRPHLYTLMVPLVVLNELDGLAQGRRDWTARPEHLAMVTECAAAALDFLHTRPPALRCVTTKGTILNSSTFTSEEDCQDMKNDDKILTTCLKLCHSSSKDEHVEGEPRKVSRDVVLLTEDRNLRVKALARDVPTREILNFMQWAGLELG